MLSDTSLNALLWIVATGFFMQSTDTTIINTALPAMAASLGKHALDLRPVVVAYSLTMAMLTPASGWLADRFGTRRVYFTSILVFVLGSAACATSHTLWALVTARIVQGIGGSMLLPVGRLAVLRTFPAERYISGLAFVAVAGQVGPLVGPVLGGWLVQVASWHWIFLINVPLGALGCVAVLRFLPHSVDDQPAPPFDWPGFALIAAAMATFSLGLDAPSHRQQGNGAIWAAILIAAAALCVLGYVLHARRRKQPLFPLSIMKQPGFALGLLGNLLARIGCAAVPFLLPLLLQLQLGYTPLHSGLMMLPVAVAGIFSKRAVAPLVRRFGFVPFLVANTVLVGLSIASFATISRSLPLPLQIVELAVFGMANSLQFAAMNGVTLKDLGREYSGTGNSLFSMVQMLAISLGVTVGGGLVDALSAHGSSAALAYRITFVFMGVVALLSTWVFVAMGSAGGRAAAAKTDAARQAS
ncbi:MFS transporter [Burkholderia sp. WAC0059]|uniref:DHA2 family efflux MFS transporter permease subunit n=1 Tax=Burkholderia sp. WAC0059 TaxID=2066022 RepID=UPI000C7E9F58|nr:DHA2 family efflux MFS transporter permease subunit [Burkholderia sp. WAC0059]PLZ02280.1 MFS transporter [Burkholderia sp. WAC0059]